MYQFIPVKPGNRNQRINVVVSVDGYVVSLQIHLRYADAHGVWLMSAYDPASGGCYVSNIPLIYGKHPCADLLRQYEYVGIGSAAVVPIVEQPSTENPIDANLGTEFALVWGDRIA